MADQLVPTILFVDDDPGSRQALTWVFRDAGFSVFEAGTGQEALDLSHERHPDLVVLDVNLPDINGFEVCQRIKAHEAPPVPAIVHLSAVFVDSGDRTQGLEGGADAYLVKPVEPRELLATVRALLRIRAAEEVARRAAQEWRTTFDAISDAVCLLDPDGRITRCNRALCRLVGRTFTEILGRPLERVLQEGFALDQPPRLMPAGCPSGHESQEVLLQGRWFRVTLDPLPAGSEAEGCVLILTDVTERKQLEEQLLQGQRLEAVGRLAGGIAHDFNNLLTAILGNASLLMRTLPPAEREHELVATMERAAWRAADLTRQLLGFSRRTLLWLRTLDPGTVLDEAVAALTPSLPAGVQLVLRRPEPLWTVQADPVQLAQVLSHLCRNAVEAMPQGGVLLLEAHNETLAAEDVHHPDARPGAFVRLRVQDTGPGIPTELLDKIFDPFFTTKPIGQGTGLGLAMVHGIVKQHQGWVQCQSTPGEGTRFDLYLPRAVADVPTQTTPTTVASPAGPRVVLLADDNDTLRSLAAAYLTQGGFQVLLAADGQEAVEMFQREQERVDLVILDQMMPHLTGRDALEQMRRIKPAVRALFATASSSDLDSQPGSELGQIAKPYRERDLLQAVHQALDPLV
jgi:PAS domain S-box-containing protein